MDPEASFVLTYIPRCRLYLPTKGTLATLCCLHGPALAFALPRTTLGMDSQVPAATSADTGHGEIGSLGA